MQLQGEDSNNGQQQGTGIVLRRKKREDSSPTKAGDALALADMVQKLCQVLIACNTRARSCMRSVYLLACVGMQTHILISSMHSFSPIFMRYIASYRHNMRAVTLLCCGFTALGAQPLV